MVICDVCKKNKATRKITYPTMSPVEYVTQVHGVDYYGTVNGCKIEDRKYDICQECWNTFAMNRSYVFQLAKEMIHKSEGGEE